MSIDERIEQEVEEDGFEPETDEFSFEFQLRLDKVLAETRQQHRQPPPREPERIRGIMI